MKLVMDRTMTELETISRGNSTVVITTNGTIYRARLFTNTRNAPREQWTIYHLSFGSTRLSLAREWAQKILETMNHENIL